MRKKTFVYCLALGAVLCLPTVAGAQLPATIDLNVTPGTEPAEVLRVLGQNGDRFGAGPGMLAYGDVNGDGYDDLIAGAESADLSGKTNARAYANSRPANLTGRNGRALSSCGSLLHGLRQSGKTWNGTDCSAVTVRGIWRGVYRVAPRSVLQGWCCMVRHASPHAWEK